MNRTMLSVLALVLLSTFAFAQGYPSKPVRIIGPFPAGAGGNIGGELAARAAPDGYTLFMTSGSIVTANQHIYRKMPFDPAKDLVAITNVASGPQVLVVTTAFPPRTIREFIALAKARPREIAFGSAGFGTQTHLATENLIFTTGIDVLHVPYKGESLALTDVIAGQVQFATPNLAAAINYIQQGKLRALGVTSGRRAPQLPEVPAIAESLPNFENLGWFGLMAPTGTPRDVIDKIHRDTEKVLALADIKSRFDGLGMAPVGNSPADFARAIREETERWAKIVRERKLVVD